MTDAAAVGGITIKISWEILLIRGGCKPSILDFFQYITEHQTLELLGLRFLLLP